MSDSTQPEYKYWAFISYSHRDKAWGDWLHRSLETYKVPKKLVGRTTTRGEAVPRRVYPVFRDREELPTAADLGANLRNAIEQSRYLLIICSPNSAKSQWVNEEILSFKRLGRENRVLALIVEGEPYASDGKAGFTVDQECFPEALRYKLGADGELSEERTEPIAGDARPHADGKRQALIKLLAGVVGVNYDELRQRERARLRRRRLLLGIASATVAVAAFFVQSQFVAEQRERQFQAATAELGRARDALNENQPANAAIAALNAIETAENAGRDLEPAWWALRRALDENRVENRWIAGGDALQECGFDQKGERLLTFNAASGEAKIWSVPEGRLLATCSAGEHAGLAGWIHESDEIVTVRSWETPAKSWSEPGAQGVDLAWWDPATGAQLRSVTIPDSYYLGLRHNADSLPEWIHLTDTRGDHAGFRLVRLSDGWAEQVLPNSENGSAVPEFVPDCGVVLLVDPATGAQLYPLGEDNATLAPLESVVPHDGLRVTSIVPSLDGTKFAALIWSGQDLLQAGVWDAADGRRVATVSGDAVEFESRVWIRAVAPDLVASRSTELLNALAPALGRQPLELEVYDASGFAWNGSPVDGGSVAVALDQHGGVSVLRPQMGWQSEIALEGASATTIAVGPTGRLAAIGDDRGRLTLWRTEAPFSLEPFGSAWNDAELDLTLFGSNDGARFLMRTASDELRVWDVATRRQAGTAREFSEPPERWLRFLVNLNADWVVATPSLPISKTLSMGTEEASFHDLKTGRILGRRPAADYVLSPVGRRALCIHNGGWKVVRAGGSELLDTRIAPSRTATSEWSGSAQFSPDGSKVIVATADGWIEIFDADSGDAIREARFAEAQEASINQLVVSPSGRWLLLATYAKYWQVDLESDASKEVFVDEDTPDLFGDRAFLDDARLLAGTAGGMTKWWSFPELAPVAQVTGNYTVSEIDSSSEELLLRSAWDHEALIVNKRTGETRLRYSDVVVVGANGKLAVIENSDDGEEGVRIVRLQDSETLAEVANLSVSAAAIASDGSRAVFVNEADGRALSLAIPFDPQDLRDRAVSLRDRLAPTPER